MGHDVKIHAPGRNDIGIRGRTRLTISYRRGPRWLQDLASRGWSAEILPVPVLEIPGLLSRTTKASRLRRVAAVALG